MFSKWTSLPLACENYKTNESRSKIDKTETLFPLSVWNNEINNGQHVYMEKRYLWMITTSDIAVIGTVVCKASIMQCAKDIISHLHLAPGWRYQSQVLPIIFLSTLFLHSIDIASSVSCSQNVNSDLSHTWRKEIVDIHTPAVRSLWIRLCREYFSV